MKRVVIIGSGNVATSLAHGLAARCEVAQIYSRQLAHARALADAVGCTNATNDLKLLVNDADAYIIAVRDDAIADAEARLGRIAEEGGKVVRAKARARLEALARKAAREGRKVAAEYYLAQAKELFGDDSGNAAEESEQLVDGGIGSGGNTSEAVRE